MKQEKQCLLEHECFRHFFKVLDYIESAERQKKLEIY